MIVKLENYIVSAFSEAFVDNKNIRLHEERIIGQPIKVNELDEIYKKLPKSKINFLWVDTDWQIRETPPSNVILLHPCQIYPINRIFFRPPTVDINQFEPLIRTDFKKPTIGFCGHSGESDRVVSYFRKNILDILQTFPELDCRFIIRNNFTGQNKEKKLTEEYLENMKSCVFNFCNRGAGPYAIRLYETLAAGRIPIFLQEQTCLCSIAPYEDACVIGKNIYDLVDKVIHTFENENIEDMQKRARKLYENFFDLPAYFRILKQKMRL